MKTFAQILQDGICRTILQIQNNTNSIIREVRKKGIKGRFEVLFIFDESERTVYSRLFINEENRIVGQIFPHYLK